MSVDIKMNSQIRWLLVVWIAIVCVGCQTSATNSPEQFWYQADHSYRTNDLLAAYRFTLKARNRLEWMSKTQPHALNYPYCLAILNGRLFLLARSLGDTNAAEQFILESGFYFNEGRKQGNLSVTNYSAETIEQIIKSYDAKVHPDDTNGIP
jgi:hypothetical protein